MNKIVKNGDEYTLITENGQEFECKRWFEKKTNSWHVVLPKDNGTGRTYVRESFFDNKNEHEFETKTNHRTGLSYGGWRNRLTEEEKLQIEKAEKLIADIKMVAMGRQPKELTEEEKLQRQIERLQEKLKGLK